MEKATTTMAQRIAQAASAFEKQRTGHAPQSITVIISDQTLVITVHGSLSPVEKELSRTPAGAAQVQEFHRQLFNSSAGTFREEIAKITGLEVREAAAEVETRSGTVVKVLTTGTMVQVFLPIHGAVRNQITSKPLAIDKRLSPKISHSPR